MAADRLALRVSRQQLLYDNIVLDLECHRYQSTVEAQSGSARRTLGSAHMRGVHDDYN